MIIFWISIVGILIFLLVAYFYKIPKNLHVKYFVTSQRVVFQNLKQTASFDLNQISSMRVFGNTNYKKVGKLFFKIKEMSYSKSPYFENIKNVDELHQLIEQTIKKNKKK